MLVRSIITPCAIGAALTLSAGAALAQGGFEAVIADPGRTTANVERDGDRTPDKLLPVLGLEEGDVALDWMAGGGYWTELFAGAVGEDGTVYATGLRGDFAYDNIEALEFERGDPIPLEDESVDLVFLSYVYHHMHYNEESGEMTPPSTATQIGEFSRILKPGGKIAVIEHQALPELTRAESAELHRMGAAHLTEDMTANGFSLTTDAPEIYKNPDDPENNSWGDAGLAGNTTSLVHVYTKD